MSKVLLSWVQPKPAVSSANWKKWREDRFFLVYGAWSAAIVGTCILRDGISSAGVFGLTMSLILLNNHFRILRSTYQLRDDGIRIKSLITSKLFRWENIEWYELWPSHRNDAWLTIYFKVRRGRELEWELFDFDCAHDDQSTLRAILEEKLAGKNLERMAA